MRFDDPRIVCQVLEVMAAIHALPMFPCWGFAAHGTRDVVTETRI
jgi:hypothetical protein